MAIPPSADREWPHISLPLNEREYGNLVIRPASSAPAIVSVADAGPHLLRGHGAPVPALSARYPLHEINLESEEGQFR